MFKKILEKIKKFFSKKEVTSKSEENTEKTRPTIALCDDAVIIYALGVMKEFDHIYLPNICYKYLKNVADGKFVDFNSDDYAQQSLNKVLARTALEYVNANKEWCSIIPNLDRVKFFVNIEEFEPKFKTRVIVSLACLYYEAGYDVCIYTRTREVIDCASLQPNIKVQFVDKYA